MSPNSTKPDDEFLDEDYDDDMYARREKQQRGRQPGMVTDFVRRALENTVGSVQSGSLPRDAIQYLLQQGDKGRKEIVRIVAKETGDFLRHTDLSSELIKVLTNIEIEASANIKFKKNREGGVTPEVSPSSRVSVMAEMDEKDEKGQTEDLDPMDGFSLDDLEPEE